MDPPESFAPSTVEAVPYESLAKPLQGLWDDHERFLKALTVFENALIELKKGPWRFSPEISTGLKQFFRAMDEEILVHTRKEEHLFFPVLHRRFIETGEHSPGHRPISPVDIMEADHMRVSQGAALVFNLLGIASRLEDAKSRETVFEFAFQQGQEIVEVMKLHIYKENTTLFPLAQKLISRDELAEIGRQMDQTLI